MTPMTVVLPFDTITAVDLPRVGGKGANLGEMTAAGFPVPDGFCVTTDAFAQFMTAYGDAEALYATLESLAADDVTGVRQAGEAIRQRLITAPIPDNVVAAVVIAWEKQGAEHAYAVRSSATAEDLPTASFAGQQDTYLNVRGKSALLDAVRACWVSLFTDRAILYRAQNGFSHRDVALSVVVQQMVIPEVSGILFTADPVSNHRHIVSIDASFGLGEALVSGLVSPDLYQVDKRTREIIKANIAEKELAIRPNPDGNGGTFRETLTGDTRTAHALTDTQVLQLAELGARVESHYGVPQDIEWAIADGEFFLLQTRPITSLFPLPHPRPADETMHVYISVSHAQVMTDVMSPMAISIWRHLFPFGMTNDDETPNPYFCSAGGRIYIDLSPLLRVPRIQKALPNVFSIVDELIEKSLRVIIQRKDFLAGNDKPNPATNLHTVVRWVAPIALRAQKHIWFDEPEGTTQRMLATIDTYIDGMKSKLQSAESDLAQLKMVRKMVRTVFMEEALLLAPYIAGAMMSLKMLEKLVGEHADPADFEALGRGLPGNVTTDMNLRVGDLADVARQSPELVKHFTTVSPADALIGIEKIAGGTAFLSALEDFMTKYGMRAPSEIDITRPRWRENPTPLLQVVIGNLKTEAAGTHRIHHQQLTDEGIAAGERLTAQLGGLRAKLAKRMVRVFRNFMAAREHPKFLLIQTMYLAKIAMLHAAEALLAQNKIDKLDDIWLLDLNELIAALENPADDLRPRIAAERADIAHFQSLTPPRVITSDGEIINSRHSDENLPEGALPGVSVSAGVVEGIAKVVLDPSAATLFPGEILVAPFTDPGWTPLFINAAGLVMEVGGLMTHGSVVAREYGIPAVVGVLDATTVLKTGQKIRVNGDSGFVEILDEEYSLSLKKEG